MVKFSQNSSFILLPPVLSLKTMTPTPSFYLFTSLFASHPLNCLFYFHHPRPWEQDRQMAIYNRTPEHIQITSHPHLPMMPWDMTKKGRHGKIVEGWCLSHLPGAGCIISHHCANKRSKQRMRETYTVSFDKRMLKAIRLLLD